EASPQVTLTCQGASFVPASVNEHRSNDALAPSSEFWSEAAATVGSTLATVTSVVYSVKPSFLSMILAFTVYVPSSAKVHWAESAVSEPAYLAPERSPSVQSNT